jgi:hypothetical protein
MGARDYVKPVSSHEAVFVGSTNFPKDLQRYNQKSRSSIRKDKRIRILQASFIVWNEPEVRINIVYNIVASTDLKSGY